MVSQYEIYWVDLNPTVGKEINKIRPCLVLSPNEVNLYFQTIVIAPYTSTLRQFPMRISTFLREKPSQIALDQIRSIDKKRLLGRMQILEKQKVQEVKNMLKKFLID